MFKADRMSYLGLIGGLVLLIVTAVQYPLSTSFPIGGDAASLIRHAIDITNIWQVPGEAAARLLSTHYPLADLILASFSLLPISWPDRYIWCLVTAQVATGVAVGWLLYRTAGWRAAALGLAIWSLTTTTINNHFEDGTLAQLWSLPFAMLFLERAYHAATFGSILALTGALLTHPLTGALLLIVVTCCLVACTLAVRPLDRTARIWLSGLALYLLIVMGSVGLLVFARGGTLEVLGVESRVNSLPDLIRSRFGPFVLLAPLGFVFLNNRRTAPTVGSVLLGSFFIIAVLSAFNNLLGETVAAFRFITYLLISCTILSSYALAYLLQTGLPTPLLRTIFILTIFVITGISTIHDGSHVYAYYEDPSNYARLHPVEQEAFAWMSAHLPAGSVLAASEANRHSEWLPIVTSHRWEGLPAKHALWRAKDAELAQVLRDGPYTHVVFLKKREDISEQIQLHPEWFENVYEDRAVIVFALHPPSPYVP